MNHEALSPDASSMEAEELLRAISAGDADAVRALIAATPAVAAARDPQGVSLLLQALYHRQSVIAEILMTARLEQRLALSLHEAAAVGNLNQLAVAASATAGEGALETWSSDGFQPLHLAAFFSQAEAIEWLIERGVGVNEPARNAMRVRPLHSGTAAGGVAVCRLLLAAGADVNACQHGGYTPLMSGAHAGNAELVAMLLEASADPSLRTDDGKTAADLARASGHEELARRLDVR